MGHVGHHQKSVELSFCKEFAPKGAQPLLIQQILEVAEIFSFFLFKGSYNGIFSVLRRSHLFLNVMEKERSHGLQEILSYIGLSFLLLIFLIFLISSSSTLPSGRISF
jgi:hypothetical protein